jgi:DNA-binding LacI/PurR family transcriptional regulator
MQKLRRLSLAEQTAAHLREGLRRGRWRGTLPGVGRLAAELDVSPPTLRAALQQLEDEGLLAAHGRGRSRTVTWRGAARHSLRVGILLHDAPLEEQPQTTQLLFQIQHDLEAAGHEVFSSGKTQVQLQHDVRRIVGHVGENPADAWVVVAGSRELLEWFAGQTMPSIALFGRTDGLALARTGPDKVPAYVAATRQLVALGHRRIVLLTRRARRKPTPGNVELAFLAELAAHGITTGDYNLPDWEETPQGFCALLERLFRVTPPTALIVEETPRVIAVMEFLARRRIHVPEQVSLVSTDYDALLAWCHPPVAHMRWDDEPIVRRIVRWVAAVRRGRADRKQINFPAQFIPGGSIGPASGAERVIVPGTGEAGSGQAARRDG